ncbi:DUF6527 family protein (plasmid) [Variovorax sp. 375MFSha3.1]|uniref:DUF6527 family protein n=1 Tax=unclassified Variovorax TaxID=663243 RepID=UPI003AAAAFB5
MSYSLAAHRCACGCGLEVVTPLSPTDWTLLFDGENVSLEPSIGNWSFPCRSHYFIRQGKIKWAANMSEDMIERGRQRDRVSKQAHYAKRSEVRRDEENAPITQLNEPAGPPAQKSRSRWVWFIDLFR